jgi:hypothetical protein
LHEFLAWMQGSPLGRAMRESGVWTYGVVNLVHILGVGSLFGSVLVLDLRLLGFWKKIPLPAISDVTAPIAATGFAVAVMSGVCLISTNATEYAGNPFIYIKFPAIGLGFLNALVLSRLSVWRERATRPLSPRDDRTLALFGGVSLFSWLTAITAGRLIGYW